MAVIDRSQHPPNIYPDYKSSTVRGPTQKEIDLGELYKGNRNAIAIERTGSLLEKFSTEEIDRDLTRNANQGGEPLGEKIVISGRVSDQWGKPVRGALIEIWQANASGRYAHKVDDRAAPLDPNFQGAGRCITDQDGAYRFYTIKPGAYPWKNHPNAWRPQHIHFSLIGETIESRLVTQMYFPGDPLLEWDPIFQSIPKHAAPRLISQFDLSITEADHALGYGFDIALAGSRATPADDHGDESK